MKDNSPRKSYVMFSPAMIPALEPLVSSPDDSKKPQPTNQLKKPHHSTPQKIQLFKTKKISHQTEKKQPKNQQHFRFPPNKAPIPLSFWNVSSHLMFELNSYRFHSKRQNPHMLFWYQHDNETEYLFPR